MKTSLWTHGAAAIAAMFLTFGMIELIANYAYPTAPAVLVASATR